MKIIISVFFFFLTLSAAVPLTVCGSEKSLFDSIRESSSGKSLAELVMHGYKSLESGEYDRSLAYYTLAVAKGGAPLTAEESRGYIKALNNIGYIFLFGKNNPEKAYPYFLQARRLAEQSGEEDLLGAILANIAKVHDDFGDPEKAIELYNLAMTHAVRATTDVSPVIQLMIFNDMVNCAMARDRVAKIAPSLDSFDSLPEYTIPMGRYSKMMCRALRLMLRGRNAEATAVIGDAGRYINSRVDSARYVTDHDLTVANLYHIRRIDDSARIYLDRALQVSRTHMLPDRLPRVYRGMAAVADAQGDSLESRRLKLLAYETDERLYSSKMYASLNTLEATQQIDDLNVRLLEADIRHSHRVTVIWILVVAIAIIVSLLVCIVIRNRHLSESLRQLVARHQASISTEEANARIRHEYENTIAALQREVEKCAQPVVEPGTATTPCGGESASSVQKHMALPVDEKERLRIIGEVNDIFGSSDEIYDPGFSLERLAELTATKPRYLSALLNDTMGKSFSVLLAETRVKKACTLLLSPDFRTTRTIESIAAEVGYRSRTSFSSVFKKITGVTPLQYVSNAT